jgi:cutinase
MAAQIKACPDIKFALAGYSQGGGVVTRAVANLPANLAERVVAIALYGAGDGTRVKDTLKEKTIANCAPGDFVSYTAEGRSSGVNVV